MHVEDNTSERDHNHSHSHDRMNLDHQHRSGKGFWDWIKTIFHVNGFDHDHRGMVSEKNFRDNEEGIRTVWLSLFLLLITAVLQLVIVYFSGSVSLLADTAHNIGDGLNSIPLLIAFYLARRLPTRRYSYGYGRAEDVAGIFIVLSIAVSAGFVFWESAQRLINPQPIAYPGWVLVAALLGFLGNEAVAVLQIRVGRKIGSAAMVADGLHARTDGLTSLAVLIAAGGAWLGFPILDPIIGFVIGFAILVITRDATRAIWYRLMDAVRPEQIERAEHVIAQVPAVREVRRVRMRWVGHRLHADVCIAVDPSLTIRQSHAVAEEVRHVLFHKTDSLAEIVVHVDPWGEDLESGHARTLHHEPLLRPVEVRVSP